MKRIQLLQCLLATSLIFGALSCSKDNDTNNGSSQNGRIIVQITDSGYSNYSTNEPDKPHSYKTEFAEGAQIGIFAVKNGKIAELCNNICLTYIDGKWTGNVYKGGAGTTYYIYYPYQSDLSTSLNADASKTDAFFASLIKNWTPDKDQGTFAGYTSSDLMTGSGIIEMQTDGTPLLQVELKHQMGLHVIQVPMIKYHLSADTKYTFAQHYPSFRFNNFLPYYTGNGNYLYLVKPQQSKFEVSYSYTNGNSSYKNTYINPYTASAGHYTVYDDSEKSTNKTYDLQVGDFYLNDGSLVSKDAVLTTAQRNACIGIVFWTGSTPYNEDQLLIKTAYNHGLVVALHNASHHKMPWSSQKEYVNFWTYDNIRVPKVNITDIRNCCGYANTKAIEAYNKSLSEDKQGYRVLPVDAVTTYNKQYPAPAKSSGWYCPSQRELTQICWGQSNSSGTSGRMMLEKQYDKAGSISPLMNYPYWSSTEFDDHKSAKGVNFEDGAIFCNDKEYGGMVLPVLAF